MPARIDTVFLDFGNVLVFHDNTLLLSRFAARAGLSVDDVARRWPESFWRDINTGRIGARDLAAEASERLGVAIPHHEFVRLWSCHFTVHEKVLPLVESLLGHARVLLLSNTNALHIEHLLPRFPILARFDGLLLSYELGLQKPDPAIFRAALVRANTAPERAVFFDDMETYVRAARSIGMHAHVFTTAERFDQQLRALGLR